jgi:hypothetical protein
MNVLLEYLYRDAGSYKNWGKVVFANYGDTSVDVLDRRIRTALIDEEFFVAKDVEVAVLFFDTYDPDLDHGWHQFHQISLTADPVTDTRQRDIDSFIGALSLSKRNGAF